MNDDTDDDMNDGTTDRRSTGFADRVQCGEPTEYPSDRPGSTLCPVCAWQEAQRTACSG
ncbi:hypothetical protein WEB32_26305 [Streptomyces netropsis]|uniref:hypothetical protein n=1 Tax=Streptomyces netropsis TaxID=55404 RepID=UPI0030D27667